MKTYVGGKSRRVFLHVRLGMGENQFRKILQHACIWLIIDKMQEYIHV